MQIRNLNYGTSYFQKRLRRFDAAGDPREFTFSCYQGFPFLDRDRTRQWFVDAVTSARQKWQFDLWAYVIMPEHVHLLVCPRIPGTRLGTVIGKIKESVARKAIQYLENHSSRWLARITVHEEDRVRRRFWQPGGGYDRNVLEVSTLEKMVDYIHANPVRRGLVEKPEVWTWSSARWYAGIRPVVINMDPTTPSN